MTWSVDPVFTNRFFLLVYNNKLGIVHYTSGYNLKKKIFFFFVGRYFLTVFLSEDIFIVTNSVDLMKCHIMWHFIWVFIVVNLELPCSVCVCVLFCHFHIYVIINFLNSHFYA